MGEKKTQFREGFPDEFRKMKRWFRLWGSGKTDLEKGWNNSDNWKLEKDFPSNEFIAFETGGTDYLFIDGDHCIKDGEIVPEVRRVIDNIKTMGNTYLEESISGTGFHCFVDLTGVCSDIPKITNDPANIIVWMNPKDYEALPEVERNEVPKIELFFHTGGRYVYLTGKHNETLSQSQILKGKAARNIYDYLVNLREGNQVLYGFRNNKENTTENYDSRNDKQKSIPKNTADGKELKRIVEVLDLIPPDNYDEWMRIGYALKNSFGDVAFSIWNDWSSKSVKYKPEEMAKKWESFNGTSNWNVGTIFKIAKEYRLEDSADDSGSEKEQHTVKTERSNSGKSKEREVELSLEECEKIAALIVQKVSDVEKKEVKWFIYPIIPKNNVTVIAAEGGVGKTSIWINIVAAVTNAEMPGFMGIPFDTKSEIGNRKVLYLTSEDPTEEVLKDRFEKAGAAQDNLIYVSLDNEHFSDIKFDKPLLEALIKVHKPTLCIFDPIQSFIVGKMGERNIMRQNLDHLTRLAKLYDTTFILIAHTNKQVTTEARNKISDSSDLWDKARSVLMVGNTSDENIKYLSHEKSNYVRLCDTFLFSIDDDGNVIHRGTTSKRYEQFAAEGLKERTSAAKDEATEFIINTLKNGEIPVNELENSALAIGIKAATLNRAKRSLKDEGKIGYRQESKGKDQGVKWIIFLKG